VRECQTPPNPTRFETRKTFFTLKLKKEKGIHAYINQDGFTNVRLLLKNKKKTISTTHCVWRHPFLIFLFLISYFHFFLKKRKWQKSYPGPKSLSATTLGKLLFSVALAT
jgi:hypothetical protein